MPVNKENSTRTRAVIVGGARTPFLRAFGDFTKMDSIALGAAAVKSLLHQSKLPVGEIDGVVWGGVILPSAAPNLGREIVLDLGLHRGCHRHPCLHLGVARHHPGRGRHRARRGFRDDSRGKRFHQQRRSEHAPELRAQNRPGADERESGRGGLLQVAWTDQPPKRPAAATPADPRADHRRTHGRGCGAHGQALWCFTCGARRLCRTVTPSRRRGHCQRPFRQ